MRLCKQIALALAIFVGTGASYQARASIAFIGDSMTTGGAAHPDIKLERESFTAILRGDRQLKPDDEYYRVLAEQNFSFGATETEPKRLLLSRREYHHPLVWFVENLWMSFGIQYLDAEKYSWSYLLSRQLGYSDQQILIAAKNGEKIERGIRQFDRILDETGGQLPDHTFIFFTGNDLCGLRMELVTNVNAYRRHLQRLLRYMARNAQASAEPKNVWLLEPLGILQIVTSGSILRHSVPYQGEQVTCRALQTMPPSPPSLDWSEGADIANFLYPFIASTPAGFCPTLFSVHGEGGSDVNVSLANRILGFREAVRELTKEMAPLFEEKNIILRSIRDTSHLVFEGEDMANDCFHLNLNGQIKIAQAVLSAMGDQ